ncbi:hypothetical protein M0802_001328 [Mischocyttarus mexicanus]|nr:hypothetical protein M0802_001328 [Mischocyttarus mexicanus]
MAGADVPWVLPVSETDISSDTVLGKDIVPFEINIIANRPDDENDDNRDDNDNDNDDDDDDEEEGKEFERETNWGKGLRRGGEGDETSPNTDG